MTILTKITNRIYYNSSNLLITINTAIKYPIFLHSLLDRIKNLQMIYPSIFSTMASKYTLVYDLSREKETAQKDLRDKGGIYILWSKTTGIFYVGSGVRLFTNGGRLNAYFKKSVIKGVIEGKNTSVNKELAKIINKYGIRDFYLIIPQYWESNTLNRSKTFQWEQIWILLYPTFNHTLLVFSNNVSFMTEVNRLKISTIFYQYEVDNCNIIIDNTEKILFGIKIASREGIIDKIGISYSIQYDTLKGHTANKMIWENKSKRFFFSTKSVPLKIIIEEQSRKKHKGVWVYDFESKELICYENSVKECLAKYNISSTHFKRIRKYSLVYQGKLFSNKPLVIKSEGELIPF